MESLLYKIAHKCLQEDLIDAEQTEWLIYTLQRRLINICGFLVLMCLGCVVGTFPQVLLLNMGVAFLREKTNGIHMPTAISCLVFSMICEFACLRILDNLSDHVTVTSLLLMVGATALIWWLAPCNNMAIHLSQEELEMTRRATHKRIALYLFLILVLLFIAPNFVNTMIVAESVTAVLLVLAKLGAGIR